MGGGLSRYLTGFEELAVGRVDLVAVVEDRPVEAGAAVDVVPAHAIVGVQDAAP